MFLISIIIGVILGFVLRGNLRNLTNVKLYGLYFVFSGCILESVVKFLLKINLLEIGLVTYASDAIMYGLLIVFVFLNRRDLYIVLMGFGSALNAIVIFANGGVMPVSQSAMDAIAKGVIPSDYGLYASIMETSKLWFLGDIIYFKFTGPFIYSIGDIISVVAMILIIISGMRGKYNKYSIINSRGRSSRKRRRERQQRIIKHKLFWKKEALNQNG